MTEFLVSIGVGAIVASALILGDIRNDLHRLVEIYRERR